jgi:hypothetical protein
MAIKHVFAEIESMQAAGVIEQYALGGAVAAINYLEPAATEDVDIFVVFNSGGSPLAPLSPIYQFLERRGAKLEGAHLIVGDWPVQILRAAGPLLEEAIREARVVEVDGQSVRIFSPEHLAVIALQTGRTKDKLRLAQFLEWPQFDKPRFEEMVNHHGLLAKWQEFKRVFTNEPPG